METEAERETRLRDVLACAQRHVREAQARERGAKLVEEALRGLRGWPDASVAPTRSVVELLDEIAAALAVEEG